MARSETDLRVIKLFRSVDWATEYRPLINVSGSQHISKTCLTLAPQGPMKIN